MCKKNQIWLRVGQKNEAIIWLVNSVQFTLIAYWLEDINWLFGFKKCSIMVSIILKRVQNLQVCYAI